MTEKLRSDEYTIISEPQTTGDGSRLAGDSWQSYTKREGLSSNTIISIFASLAALS